MVDVPSAPDPLPAADAAIVNPDDAAATERSSRRRWMLGIVLTTVLNLAATATTIGGLWLQGRSVDLEYSKAVQEQMAAAQEKISSPEVGDQVAGFGLLSDVMRNSPERQGYVLASAETYLLGQKAVAEKIPGLTGKLDLYVANPGTQAAVDLIRSRNIAQDPGGPGQRAFNLTGMQVGSVRFNDVVMRSTRGSGCHGNWTLWDKADLKDSEFRECNFEAARFVGAKLQDVNFTGAFLNDADFTDADLTKADFGRAVFNSKTKFQGADLSGATFTGKLGTTNFVGVKSIAGADFSQAKEVERAQNLRNAPGHEYARWPESP
ncbi:pentapeptide repeat-containing protein [Saccharopolyspora shandongensis]|uniref:pentapeptide repeat-containing protein n=1 Tax=Saccharopolyspora shandongensis TaxID=418495 RepID=UPI0033E1D481